MQGKQLSSQPSLHHAPGYFLDITQRTIPRAGIPYLVDRLSSVDIDCIILEI